MEHVDNDLILGLDPHTYTSGRWLRNDEHERETRQVNINFDEICQRVEDTFNGERSIIGCENKEGGFNRVFIFTLDNGSRVVARLPFTFAGPAKLATASEVATIHYRGRHNNPHAISDSH